MVEKLFSSVLDTASGTFDLEGFLLCALVSLALGLFVAALTLVRSESGKGFFITVTLLPAMVEMIIMLVNGNVGTGVAVMGAFSLVRFRSAPGSAREIASIFLAMAVGLATGMGYLGCAALFAVILGPAFLLLSLTRIGEGPKDAREMTITIPESLEYPKVFEDIFQTYLRKWELRQVRTTNMGSLYKLRYRIVLREEVQEKEFIDALRCRNGNLEILCGLVADRREEL